MARDVYLIGLFDDSMSYYMVDQEEWDRFNATPGSVGEWRELDKAIVIPEITLSPEDYAEWVADGKPDDICPEGFDIMTIIKLVKDGVINVLDAAEGLEL